MVAEQLKKLTLAALLIATLLFSALPATTLAQEQVAPLIATDSQKIRILADGDYFPALIEQLNHAGLSIDLTMFIFKTGKRKGDRPAEIRDALARAAKRGVKVRVFLEKSGYDEKLNEANQKVAEQLAAAGVTVIFESPKTTTHNKMVVVDRRYAMVGSHNFTQAALRYNHELSLLVDDRALAEKLVSYMEDSIQP